MTFGPRAGFAFFATALIGCSGNEPLPELFNIQPSRAYSNQDVRVQLVGADLIPSFRVDPSTDQRVAIMDGFSGRIGKEPVWAPLTHFGWLGPKQISATLGSGVAESLPPGLYDVEITDPRGRRAILTGAFEEIGVDGKSPEIAITSPAGGEPFCPGAIIHAHITVNDQEPGYLTSVAWLIAMPPGEPGDDMAGSCPIEPGSSTIHCDFDVTIDDRISVGKSIYLSVTAYDAAKNRAVAQSTVLLGDRPSVKSMSTYAGPTTGGTDIVITGSGFLFEDSKVYFGDDRLYPLHPNGGHVIEAGTVISGYTPAHPEGKVQVRVVSRLGEVVLPKPFTYQPPPSGGTP